jgi:hypothetical protein
MRMEKEFTAHDGCTYQSELDYIVTERLNMCGCGHPEETARWVLRFLKQYETDAVKHKLWEQFTHEESAQPLWFIAHQFTHMNYLEHGGNVGCSWLTELGRRLIADLERVLAKAD